MALVKVKPTSPGRRGVVKVVNDKLHKGRPLPVWLKNNPRTLAVTTMVALPFVIRVVARSSTIA